MRIPDAAEQFPDPLEFDNCGRRVWGPLGRKQSIHERERLFVVHVRNEEMLGRGRRMSAAKLDLSSLDGVS